MHSIKDRIRKHLNWVESIHLCPPQARLEAVVVIPSFKEPGIVDTVASVIEAANCLRRPVEVIVVLNKGMSNEAYGPGFGKQQFDTLVQLDGTLKRSYCRVYTLLLGDLPAKYAGVGLCRRVGMDLAAERLRSQKPIYALDADSIVSKNYFTDARNAFDANPDIELVHFQFAHSVPAINAPTVPPIILYELHLRYFRHALEWAGHPYSVYTIGSSFAVRASAYKLTGGMNRRKAGEDFYFVQKYAERKKYMFAPEVKVFPSGRISDRVPFGTGKAVSDIVGGSYRNTYNWSSFIALRSFFSSLESWYQTQPNPGSLKPALQTYLMEEGFGEKWSEALDHSNSYGSFRDKFFRWFNAFRAMKCLHFLRDNGFPDQQVMESTHHLCRVLGIAFSADPTKQLELIRNWEETN